MRREVRATANRLANFDDANLRRSARAAVAAGARVHRAMEILGEEIPDHLKEAGALRLEHKQASLEELGQLAQPPMTKDAVAGRIRRLLAMADKRAQDLGIPGTEANLTPDMLDATEPHRGSPSSARATSGCRWPCCSPSTTTSSRSTSTARRIAGLRGGTQPHQGRGDRGLPRPPRAAAHLHRRLRRGLLRGRLRRHRDPHRLRPGDQLLQHLDGREGRGRRGCGQPGRGDGGQVDRARGVHPRPGAAARHRQPDLQPRVPARGTGALRQPAPVPDRRRRPGRARPRLRRPPRRGLPRARRAGAAHRQHRGRGREAVRQHLPRHAGGLLQRARHLRADPRPRPAPDHRGGRASTRGSGRATTTRRSATAATACPRTPSSSWPTTRTCRSR